MLIYDITLFFLSISIRIAALFGNAKAKLWIEGRKNIFQKVKNKISELNTPNSKLIWFHCASLGEFEQGRPLIESIKALSLGRGVGGEAKIILTFFSPSGYEIRKNYEHANAVFYLPLDTKENAKKFIELIQPSMVFFIKYEFWYHYFMELHKRKIPVYVVSAIFRPDQLFFKWYGGLFRKLLKTVKHFFVQNENSKSLLNSLGINNVTVSGDTRFDRVFDTCQNVKSFPLIEKFKDNKKVLIAGSTWEQDEKLLVELATLSPSPLSQGRGVGGEVKLIIAPHEIHESHIQSIIQQLKNLTIVRYSQANEENVKGADVLVIDNIGMLSSLYQYGNIAYIGGGFSKGIHNILEAATFGMPVIFGPNYEKFQEAKELIRLGGAFSIDSYEALEKTINFLLGDELVLKMDHGVGYVEIRLPVDAHRYNTSCVS